MVVISNNGKIVSRSHDLAGLIRYAGKNKYINPIRLVAIGEETEGAGSLHVAFRNGSVCNTEFASFVILCEWLANSRNLRYAPLTIRNQGCGYVSYDNTHLREYTRF